MKKCQEGTDAKKGSAAERELQGTDLKAYRGTTKICDAVIHALRCWIFCIIFGDCYKDIRNMNDDELLDMDYFLNEDDLFADEAGVEGFYIF